VTETRIVPDSFRRCYGWAYESCDMPPSWVCIVIYREGGWDASPVCNRHAAAYLGDTSSWTQEVESRTLLEVGTARRIWVERSESL